MTHGAPFYIGILGALVRGPATLRQLKGNSRNTVNVCRALRQMRRYRMVHVSGWSKDAPGRPAAVWRFGAGVDVAPVGGGKAPAPPARPTVAMIALAAMVDSMRRGPATANEMAAASGLSAAAVWANVRLMRAAGVCHIDAWEKTAPAYSFGPGPDAPRPKREDKRVIEVRYYRKKKARKEQMRLLGAICGTSLQTF
jgi:hypothetical protein